MQLLAINEVIGKLILLEYSNPLLFSFILMIALTSLFTNVEVKTDTEKSFSFVGQRSGFFAEVSVFDGIVMFSYHGGSVEYFRYFVNMLPVKKEFEYRASDLKTVTPWAEFIQRSTD